MFNEIVIKRALRMAVALAIAVFAYRYFSITQGFWVPLTTIIVLQPTLSATLRKGMQRFIGTIIGIIVGSIIAFYAHEPWQFDILLVLMLFVAYYLKSFNLVNYGIFVVPLTAMVVMLVSELLPADAGSLILARIIDTSLGAFIAVAISFIFLPVAHEKVIKKGFSSFAHAAKRYRDYLSNNKAGTEEQGLGLRQQLENSLLENQIYYQDSHYEYVFNKNKRIAYKTYIVNARKLTQLLIGFDDLLSSSDESPGDLMGQYQALIEKQFDVFELSNQ